MLQYHCTKVHTNRAILATTKLLVHQSVRVEKGLINVGSYTYLLLGPLPGVLIHPVQSVHPLLHCCLQTTRHLTSTILGLGTQRYYV